MRFLLYTLQFFCPGRFAYKRRAAAEAKKRKRMSKQPVPTLDGVAPVTSSYRHVNTINGYTSGAVGIRLGDLEYEGIIMNPLKINKYAEPKQVGFVKSNCYNPMNGKPLYKLYIIPESYD